MLHVLHTAQHTQHAGIRTIETESPRRYATFGLLLLQARYDMVGQFAQSSAQQRLHNQCRDATFLHFAIDVIHTALLPIQVVHLDKDNIPMHLVVHGHQLVERLFRAMERESQSADASGGTFLLQVVYHAVVHKARTELAHVAHRM